MGCDDIYEGKAVPRVGDLVVTQHLEKMAELLRFPDDEDQWVVEEVEWVFGDLADEAECDVTVWVTNKHLDAAVDAFFERAESQLAPREDNT